MDKIGTAFDVFKNSFNVLVGSILALFSFMVDDFNWLFLSFFLLNIIDYITGWAKAYFCHVENSNLGAKGIAKKAGYWIVIGITFYISVVCYHMGRSIGYDFAYIQFLGYFTLCTYIFNEIRSIIENLVVMDVDMPPYLQKVLDMISKGLQVTAEKQFKLTEKKETIKEEGKDG